MLTNPDLASIVPLADWVSTLVIVLAFATVISIHAIYGNLQPKKSKLLAGVMWFWLCATGALAITGSLSTTGDGPIALILTTVLAVCLGLGALRVISENALYKLMPWLFLLQVIRGPWALITFQLHKAGIYRGGAAVTYAILVLELIVVISSFVFFAHARKTQNREENISPKFFKFAWAYLAVSMLSLIVRAYFESYLALAHYPLHWIPLFLFPAMIHVNAGLFSFLRKARNMRQIF
jgi:hypothetical protein